jgi:hypothetical protein
VVPFSNPIWGKSTLPFTVKDLKEGSDRKLPSDVKALVLGSTAVALIEME